MASFSLANYEVNGQDAPHFKDLGLYRGQSRSTGQEVIIKPLRNLAQNPKSQQYAQDIGTKVRSLDHPVLTPLLDQVISSVDVINILGPKESIANQGKPATALAAERVNSRSDHLAVLESHEITAIALQVIHFLRYLHNKPFPDDSVGLPMRDLRPEAIWITGSGATLQVHLLDLGAAMMTEEKYLESLDYRTLPYVSPEVLHKKRGTFADDQAHEMGKIVLSTACDMWSFGLTLLDLATGFKTRSVRRGSLNSKDNNRNVSGTQTPTSLLTRSNSGSSFGSNVPQATDASMPGICLLSSRSLSNHNLAGIAESDTPPTSVPNVTPARSIPRRNSTGTVPPPVPTSTHSNAALGNEWTFEEQIFNKMTEQQRFLFNNLSFWVQELIKGCLIEDVTLRVTSMAEMCSDIYDRELLRHENAVHAMKVAEKDQEVQRLTKELTQVTSQYQALQAHIKDNLESLSEKLKFKEKENIDLTEANAALKAEVDRLRAELIRK